MTIEKSLNFSKVHALEYDSFSRTRVLVRFYNGNLLNNFSNLFNAREQIVGYD